jgi:hypothetical protein
MRTTENHLSAVLRILALAAIMMVAACARNAPSPGALAPVSPQPGANAAPGLTVTYYPQTYRDVSEVDAAAKRGGGRTGPPILQLNRKSPGSVYGSGMAEGVGMRAEGLLRFPSAGAWTLVALSNDGVSVALSDRVVLQDGDVHADRYSAPATVEVPAAGWYKLAVSYFQRRGTWALQLYWKPPGGKDLALIPAEAYAHTN